jgi:hypothetical protein
MLEGVQPGGLLYVSGQHTLCSETNSTAEPRCFTLAAGGRNASSRSSLKGRGRPFSCFPSPSCRPARRLVVLAAVSVLLPRSPERWPALLRHREGTPPRPRQSCCRGVLRGHPRSALRVDDSPLDVLGRAGDVLGDPGAAGGAPSSKGPRYWAVSSRAAAGSIATQATRRGESAASPAAVICEHGPVQEKRRGSPLPEAGASAPEQQGVPGAARTREPARGRAARAGSGGDEPTSATRAQAWVRAALAARIQRGPHPCSRGRSAARPRHTGTLKGGGSGAPAASHDSPSPRADPTSGPRGHWGCSDRVPDPLHRRRRGSHCQLRVHASGRGSALGRLPRPPRSPATVPAGHPARQALNRPSEGAHVRAGLPHHRRAHPGAARACAARRVSA